MKEYVYPALFHPNEDGTFTITYPDLPGCISEGKSLGNAMYMAQSALSQWIEYLLDKKQEIPPASQTRDINLLSSKQYSILHTTDHAKSGYPTTKEVVPGSR